MNRAIVLLLRRRNQDLRWAHFGVAIFLFSTLPLAGQVLRDANAIQSLTNSITIMGKTPQDSTAVATVVLADASFTKGSLIAVTRGLDETAEQITSASGTQKLVFSRGISNDRRLDAKPGEDPSSFELSLTAQSPVFPLPWLASRFANSDVSIVFLGASTGASAMHLQLTNTFASNPRIAHYASFTTSEVWLDAKSSLPIRISFERRNAGGPAVILPVAYEYSDYRSVQGVLYPFLIRKYVNGVLWGTISIQSVQLNSGVFGSAFALQ